MKHSKLINTITLAFAFGMSAYILIREMIELITVGDAMPTATYLVFILYLVAVMRSCIIGYRQL